MTIALSMLKQLLNPWITINSDDDLPDTRFDVQGGFLVVENGQSQKATYAFADKTWADLKGKIIHPIHYMPIPPAGGKVR